MTAKKRKAYTVAQVAEQLGDVTERFVYHLLADGSLRSFKLGRRRLVAAEDLDAYIDDLREQEQRARAAAAARPAKGAA